MSAENRDWSIQEVARLAGTTSRTLRHYDEVGLVPPSRIGSNGYRYYDASALVRLQRVLLLRDLGLGIPTIAEVLAGQQDDTAALASQLELLQQERERIARQIASIERTIEKRRGGEPLMAEDMFDGFDHTVYRDEVETRWGREAYATSDSWWRGMSDAERAAWKNESARLLADWRAAAERGVDPESAEAQALAERQAAWLRAIPGTPHNAAGESSDAYLTGLAEMYVADPRFAANYGGASGAGFVRDALVAYVSRRAAG